MAVDNIKGFFAKIAEDNDLDEHLIRYLASLQKISLYMGRKPQKFSELMAHYTSFLILKLQHFTNECFCIEIEKHI